MSQRGAFRLLNGGSLHQRPKVLVDRLLLVVSRLGEAAQKHHHNNDVLANPSKLRGVIPSIQDVTLDLTGMTLSVIHWVTRMWHSVLRQHRWRLALPPLS